MFVKCCRYVPLDILNYTYEQLTRLLAARYAKGAFHAATLMREVYRGSAQHHKASGPHLTASLARLIQEINLDTGHVTSCTTEDEAFKWVTRLRDGSEIESVILSMATHQTICISSQVGCRMGCRFCRTGQMGLIRNLSVAEIVGQVFRAKIQQQRNIRNVVFMGMGEPLDNLDNVIQAIRVLSDQRGLDIAKRYITVSTAGLVNGIRRLGELNWPRLNLAVSLNAPDNTIRSRLMPINRRFPLDQLQKTLAEYPRPKKGVIFFEYILIPGINDRRQHARRLAAYLRPLPHRLNLIPYNPIGKDSEFTVPSRKDLDRFHNWLIAEAVFVRRRKPKGTGIAAACGQLGNHRRAEKLPDMGSRSTRSGDT